MTGQIYKLKPKFHDPASYEYIVMETLNNVVCLMNNVTNNVFWVSKHVLKLDYDFKKGEE